LFIALLTKCNVYSTTVSYIKLCTCIAATPYLVEDLVLGKFHVSISEWPAEGLVAMHNLALSINCHWLVEWQ